MHIVKLNKPAEKLHVWFQIYDAKEKLTETVKISVATWLWEGRISRKSSRDFGGSEIILYDTVMVDTQHYAFVRIHSNAKSES